MRARAKKIPAKKIPAGAVPWVGFGGTFVLILVALLVFVAYVQYGDGSLATYEMVVNSGMEENDNVGMSVTIFKNWLDESQHPQTPVGAQYDMAIANHTDRMLSDWTLSVNLPKEAFIDSSWNGMFRIEGDKLIVDCVDYNAEIQPGESITLGAVLYSDALFMLPTAEFSGHVHIDLLEEPIFWILLMLHVLWLCVLIVYLIFRKRAAEYIARQKRDGEIILQSMNTFAGLIDSKDPYTSGHSTRVEKYAAELGRRMQLSEDEVRTLSYMALMHDCGKIGIPDSILTKPGSLTDEERKIIQSHTVVGGKVLENFTAIPEIRLGALYHHERYDGNGYPEGLKGEEIPFCARLICVADSYDAMSSERCYRKAMPKEIIVRELEENAGRQFDPVIVGHMLDMIREGAV